MKYRLFFLATASLLLSCAKNNARTSAPIKAPPADISLDFKPIFAELLPDSHENLTNGAKPQRACLSKHTKYSNDNDVIGAIVEKAKSHRIVIVNEAHNRASHRTLTLRLASELKNEGYSIFAAETFSGPPGQHETRQEELYHRGFPLKRDGYYTVEPVFGQVTQDILALGYRPIFYEIEGSPADVPRKDRIAIREETQADNLIKRAIEKYPDEKILIHVGYSHGKELPDKFGNVWMAMRIKEKTGIDPLTISQTACEGGNVNQGKTRLKVLMNPSLLHTHEGYDMLVMHPSVQYENGRGTWLKNIGREFVPVPKKLRHPTEWRYVLAYRLPYDLIEDLGDKVYNSDQPVVHDSLLLGPGQKHYLALKPGHYVVGSYNRELRLKNQTNIRVN